MSIYKKQFSGGMRRSGSALLTMGILMLAVVGSSGVSVAQQTSTKEQPATGMPDSETPRYTADGKLIPFSPEVYRQWIFVGTPLTPNDLNDGESSFPEFHNVYINPTAFREWQKSGTFPEGTVMVKELTSVGAKQATSGNGYFEGEFTGLEMSIKDTKRFPAVGKGWAYFSFGHKYPLKKETAANAFTSCAQCHVLNAASDMVFTQYYPVLRAAKGPK
jgi:hypothetical protein